MLKLTLTLADILEQGFDAVELDDNIYMITDFMKQEEIDAIKAEIATYTDEDWLGHYMNHLRDRAERDHGTRDIEQLQKDGIIEITFDWADKNIMLKNEQVRSNLTGRINQVISKHPELLFNGVGTIQRQYEGSELKVHVDNHTNPLCMYAAIIYVNDDYTAGELIFPTRDLKIKPPAGALMLFSGQEEYPHGVNPPGPGPLRYVLPSFFTYIDLESPESNPDYLWQNKGAGYNL